MLQVRLWYSDSRLTFDRYSMMSKDVWHIKVCTNLRKLTCGGTVRRRFDHRKRIWPTKAISRPVITAVSKLTTKGTTSSKASFWRCSYIKAVSTLGIQKHVVFEDSTTGLLSARGTSPKVIVAVDLYGTHQQKLRSNGAHMVIENFTDLAVETIMNYSQKDEIVSLERIIHNSVRKTIARPLIMQVSGRYADLVFIESWLRLSHIQGPCSRSHKQTQGRLHCGRSTCRFGFMPCSCLWS